MSCADFRRRFASSHGHKEKSTQSSVSRRRLGHAVLMARELVGDEPFAVLLADDVIDGPAPCLRQMMDVFDETQSSVLATQVIEGRGISAYGVLDAQPVEGKFDGRLYEVSNL